MLEYCLVQPRITLQLGNGLMLFGVVLMSKQVKQMEALNHLLQIGTHVTFFQEFHMKTSHCHIKEKWVVYTSGGVYRDFGFNKLISSHDATDPNVPNCDCSFMICLQVCDSWKVEKGGNLKSIYSEGYLSDLTLLCSFPVFKIYVCWSCFPSNGRLHY